jgi:hypothetical protein
VNTQQQSADVCRRPTLTKFRCNFTLKQGPAPTKKEPA